MLYRLCYSKVFYRALNSLYGIITRAASKEVILSSIKAKFILQRDIKTVLKMSWSAIKCQGRWRLTDIVNCTAWRHALIIASVETNSLNVAVKRIPFKIVRNCNDIVKSWLSLNVMDMSVLLTYLQPGRKNFYLKFIVSNNCLRNQFNLTAITYLQQLI